LDDTLVWADTKKELISICRDIEKEISYAGLTINERKSVRGTEEVTYCGYRYGFGKCTPERSDDTIRKWPVPKNVTTRPFLELVHVSVRTEDQPAFAPDHSFPRKRIMTRMTEKCLPLRMPWNDGSTCSKEAQGY
jgi:hypothetical protein